jgi:hypothetical protein
LGQKRRTERVTMKKLPIGASDFKKLRTENKYFVDKSLFIQDIIEEDSEIVLLPRPRRFGKTLNLTMLRYFLEKTDKPEETKKLFSGLAIEKEDIFEEHICRYPVIYLTFKDIKASNFEHSLKSIKRLIAREYRRHSYLLSSEQLEDFDKEDFQSILSVKADISLFENSLLDLSHYLYKHYKEKPVILIDEYDTPIISAYAEGYYKETINFFKSFLGAGLKDNPNIYKGVMTGILRVAKESIFSDMNNLGVYSFLRSKFSDKFGLTEEEVFSLLHYYKEENKIKNVREWYNGYTFGGNTIYNPWSIINYAANIIDGPIPYWVNTSSNLLIQDILKDSHSGLKEELYNLLKDIPLYKKIEENISFEYLKSDESTIYSFLLFCGYLKAYECSNVEDEKYCKLQIPNREVKLVFKNIIVKWLNEAYKDYDKLRIMLKALIKGDVQVFEEILNDFVITTLSYFNTGGKKEVERVYQAFILGLLVNLSIDYEVTSEKESGYGRYDISIVPKDKSKKAIIMELKRLNSDETADTALKNALAQIKEKKYEAGILAKGISDIEKLGVVFDGKRVWVKKASSL